MPKLKYFSKQTALAVILFLIGTLLGSGAIWNFAKAKYDEEILELDKIKQIVGIRGELEPILRRIIELREEYDDIKGSESSSLKIRQKRTQLYQLKENYMVYEEKLAKIENREPQVINLDFDPPGDVINFYAIPNNNMITLNWTNPSDKYFAGVMIRYRTDTHPKSYLDGKPIPNGNGGKIPGKPNSKGTYRHGGLETGKIYYYSAFSYDYVGNYNE